VVELELRAQLEEEYRAEAQERVDRAAREVRGGQRGLLDVLCLLCGT
jgi:hypothetical protein